LNLTNRRGLFSLGTAALLAAAIPGRRAAADTSTGAQPAAPIEQLNNALMQAMQEGGRTPFATRYNTLAPVIERVFDLNAVLARSVGLSWASMPEQQKAVLAAAFKRYTVSSYVSNFDSYNGQRFQVQPATRTGGEGQVVVRSQLVRASGSPVTLDYVMQSGPSGWRVVDVLMDGSISRVAVQRSDFRELLRGGGVQALASSLEHKVANLSGGIVG
jgi:phospholipid transport system substrate-binding protein